VLKSGDDSKRLTAARVRLDLHHTTHSMNTDERCGMPQRGSGARRVLRERGEGGWGHGSILSGLCLQYAVIMQRQPRATRIGDEHRITDAAVQKCQDGLIEQG
jgi:hypothetical protein